MNLGLFDANYRLMPTLPISEFMSPSRISRSSSPDGVSYQRTAYNITPASFPAPIILNGMRGYETAVRDSGAILLSFVLEADQVTELLQDRLDHDLEQPGLVLHLPEVMERKGGGGHIRVAARITYVPKRF